MKDILEILQTLQDTPLPNLLVVGGFVFLLLAFVGKFGAFIELPQKRQQWAGTIGVLLLIAGIILFSVPESSPPNNSPADISIVPSNPQTPTIDSSAGTPVVPTNIPGLTATLSPPTSLITYFSHDGNRQILNIMRPDGTPIPLALNSDFADMKVLSVSPDLQYLAIAVTREGKVTWGESHRFAEAEDVRLIIVSGDGESVELFTNADGRGVYATYTSAPTQRLVIALLEDSQVSYYVADWNGHNLQSLYNSPIIVATTTPVSTEPAP